MCAIDHIFPKKPNHEQSDNVDQHHDISATQHTSRSITTWTPTQHSLEMEMGDAHAHAIMHKRCATPHHHTSAQTHMNANQQPSKSPSTQARIAPTTQQTIGAIKPTRPTSTRKRTRNQLNNQPTREQANGRAKTRTPTRLPNRPRTTKSKPHAHANTNICLIVCTQQHVGTRGGVPRGRT